MPNLFNLSVTVNYQDREKEFDGNNPMTQGQLEDEIIRFITQEQEATSFMFTVVRA